MNYSDRVYLREWAAKRLAFVASIKTEAGCADCGYNTHAAALQFDHLAGTDKKFDIGAGYQRRFRDLMYEIAKCDVVCANCHQIRTSTRGAGRPRLEAVS